MMNLDLILASSSPRRQQILKAAGFDFRVQASHVEESYPADLAWQKVPTFLAEKKAEALFHLLKDKEVLLAADTIVVLEGEVMGKPKDAIEAKEMLLRLSGRSHGVVSGVCLWSKQQKVVFHDITHVHFRVLEEAEIDYYIQHQPPLDKAGAYGIQEWIGMVGVSAIEGSFYNVVGLPIEKVYKNLVGFSE